VGVGVVEVWVWMFDIAKSVQRYNNSGDEFTGKKNGLP